LVETQTEGEKMSLEDTVNEALGRVNEMHEAYVELEGTEIPTSIDEAIKQRWEITVATVELAGFTAYSLMQQEEDSRRAVPLAKVYRVIRDLEEQVIKKTVLHPQELFTNAFFTVEFGILNTIVGTATYVLEGLKQALLHPAQAWEAIWIGVSNLILLRFVKSLDVIAIPELAKTFFAGMAMREKAVKELRKLVLPQRSGPRYRVKRPSRK
jgi:cation transport ATPase